MQNHVEACQGRPKVFSGTTTTKTHNKFDGCWLVGATDHNTFNGHGNENSNSNLRHAMKNQGNNESQW